MSSSRLFASASSEGINRKTSVPMTTTPLTIAGWAKVSDASAFGGLAFLGNDGYVDRYYALGSSAYVHAYTRNGGTTRDAETSAGPSNDTWFHFAGVWNDSSDRYSFFDGGNKGTQGDAVTEPSGIDTLAFGYFADSSPSAYLNGNLYMVGIWDVALSDANIASLAGGADPTTIEGGDLVALYWTGAETDEDQAGSYDLETEVGSPEWDSGDIPSVFLSGSALPIILQQMM